MRHPFETCYGTGILTRFPSTTTLVLALETDLPWADDLYPGTLRLPADRTLTCLLVYLYLHSLFHPLQQTLQLTFVGPWNAPLPTYPYR